MQAMPSLSAPFLGKRLCMAPPLSSKQVFKDSGDLNLCGEVMGLWGTFWPQYEPWNSVCGENAVSRCLIVPLTWVEFSLGRLVYLTFDPWYCVRYHSSRAKCQGCLLDCITAIVRACVREIGSCCCCWWWWCVVVGGRGEGHGGCSASNCFRGLT